jgi:maltooligosyltrehalose trehalohydrolase
VFCIQNHDQVGNRPFGDRLNHSIDTGRYLGASAMLLFAPETPLIFMGQEFAASTPFYYFTDHHEELGRLVTEGRRQEFAGFDVFRHEHLRERIPDPQQSGTAHASRLDFDERDRHACVYRWYRDLLAFRRNDPVMQVQDRSQTSAVALGFSTFLVRRWRDGQARLLIANLGHATSIERAQFDLEAPGWSILLDSNDPRYGGIDPRFELGPQSIQIPARSSAVLIAERQNP